MKWSSALWSIYVTPRYDERVTYKKIVIEGGQSTVDGFQPQVFLSTVAI